MNYSENDIQYFFNHSEWKGSFFVDTLYFELNRKNGLDASMCPCMDIDDVIMGALNSAFLGDEQLLKEIKQFVFTVPLKDVPLFINDPDFGALAKWRLSLKK